MKNIINWNYERASWQWDLLCILIMCFIFLTPKEWFNKTTFAANQSQPAAVKVENNGCEIAVIEAVTK
ncbi:MAG: hypothetical protein WBO10_15025 [Pyrinomonadaceae bacterium]